MLKQFLIILSGLPASGKSTLANKVKRKIESSFNLYVGIIDPDLIRKELSPTGFNSNLEHHVRKKHLEEIEESISKGFIAISDDLNYYTSMRHELKEIAEKYGIKYYIIHVSTPLDRCLNWNNKRGNPVPNQVIHSIFQKFDAFDNYKWDSPFFEFDLSIIDELDIQINKLINRIEQDLVEKKCPPRFDSDSKEINEQLDTITREIVGKFLEKKEYQKLKSKIIKLRKRFVRMKKNKLTSTNLVATQFINFLKENLNQNIETNKF